jgi:predicted RNA-binding protein YlqC (UPF0109 family)
MAYIFALLVSHLKSLCKGEVYMKELIAYIAQSLVDRPGEVSVSEVEGNQTTVLELKVAKEDLGKVIGKQGRTAQAMRTILSAVSSKVKKRTVLEIIE